MKLNAFVQSVKDKHNANKKQIGELDEMFKELNGKIQNVFKDQSSGGASAPKQKKGATGGVADAKK